MARIKSKTSCITTVFRRIATVIGIIVVMAALILSYFFLFFQSQFVAYYEDRGCLGHKSSTSMRSSDKAEVGDTTSLSFTVKTADGHYVQVNGTAVMEKDISIDYDFLKGLELEGDFKISAVKAFIMAETRMAALEDTREDLKPSNLENWTAIRLGRHGKGITFAITSFGDKSVAKVKQNIAIARHRHQAHFRSQPGIPFF